MNRQPIENLKNRIIESEDQQRTRELLDELEDLIKTTYEVKLVRSNFNKESIRRRTNYEEEE